MIEVGPGSGRSQGWGAAKVHGLREALDQRPENAVSHSAALVSRPVGPYAPKRVEASRSKGLPVIWWLLCACRMENPAFVARGQSLASSAVSPEESKSSATSDTTGDSTIVAEGGSAGSSSSSSSSWPEPQGTNIPEDLGPVWSTEAPAPRAESYADHCLQGAKVCFLFDSMVNQQLSSRADETPRYDLRFEGVSFGLSGGPSPFEKGWVFSDESKVESRGVHPIFPDQDFAVDMAIEPSGAGQVYPAALVDVAGRLRLVQQSENRIRCSFDPKYNKAWLIREVEFKTQADKRLSVACFLYQGRLYLWTQDALDRPADGAIAREVVASGGKVTVGRSYDSTDIDPFQGTIYLLRFWNNIGWMRKALMQEAQVHFQGATLLPELEQL